MAIIALNKWANPALLIDYKADTYAELVSNVSSYLDKHVYVSDNHKTYYVRSDSTIVDIYSQQLDYAQFPRVNTYSDLPSAATHTNQYYHVLNTQGTKWLPGSLGGTFYNKGIYYSNGTSWSFLEDIPYNATQATVDTGTNDDQFVTPKTFTNASKWSTKQDTLGYTPVPNTRQLTINSTTYDLSADRSWTIPSYVSPLTNKGDIFVRNASADTRLPIGLDTQVLIADSAQSTGMKWGTNTAPTPLGYYGAWQDDNTQSATANNVGVAMIFRTADVTPNGISIVNNGSGDPTRITFANTGIYNLQFSAQFQNTDNAQQDINIWLRLNGSDLSGTNGLISVPARKSALAGEEGHIVVGWNYVLNVVAGQYYELYWSTTNYINVTMKYYAAGSPPPSTSAVILTVTQQSGIMAGTGITAINSLTSSAQTLATGTSGTDFNISSATSTHTFNLPTASATNRGALSAADWTTFNNKQASLGFTPVPNTRTLTINGTSYDLSADRSWTVSASSGIWGIANSSGAYTFYSTFASAVAAASAGQCIELFADITESTNTTCILKNGVNIDGHGHTYTLSQSGTASCFSDNGVQVTCNIYNLTVKRTGGTSSNTNSLCFNFTASGTKVNFSGCYITSDFGTGVYVGGSSQLVTGAFAYCYKTGIWVDSSSARISNCYGEGYGSNNTYGIYTFGIADYCTGITSGGTAYAGLLVDSAGTASNCIGRSSISKGIESAGRLFNSYGFSNAARGIYLSGGIATNCAGYSTALDGLHNAGATAIRCVGYSTSNYGIIDAGGAYEDCSAFATANAAMSLNGGWIKGGTIKCSYNNAAGHGLVITGTPITGGKGVFGTQIETLNTSANSINAASAYNLKYGQLIYWGSPTTPINANITQAQLLTQDIYGNLKIG